MASKRILLVDHDQKSLTYTRNLLQTAGFDVLTCSDGITALENFRTINPDLVLLSPMLPKMHGFEVCSNIRKLPNGTKIPVVIITDVYKGKRYRMDAISKYGATEYIEKPIEDSALLTILQNLVGTNGLQPQNVQPQNPVAEIDAERTMSISQEDLMQAVKQVEKIIPKGPTAPSAAKKPARTRVDDDIDRKLEESLAGLSLDFSKGTLAKLKSKPKPSEPAKVPSVPKPAASVAPKPAASPVVASAPQVATPTPQAVAPPQIATPVPQTPSPAPQVQPKTPPPQQASVGASADDTIFTSEDLFTDVIASVEKELEHQKIITKSGVKQKTNPIPAPAKTEEEISVSSFEEELEKRISSTLSGIVKDKPKTEPVASKTETPAPKAEDSASPPTVQLTREFVQEAMSAATTTSEGINFGQYLLLSKIAAGGMAELFKAKRKGVEGFEKILAIKRILPYMVDNEEFITMFIDEAKLAAQLTHQNICQIFDLGKIENSYYIAMEFVHGKDLRAVLRSARVKQKPVPVELAILITSKICSALDYAHRKNDMSGKPLNLVHRDVSPQNILISYEGDVKLVDFGIAKATNKVHVTQHGALKGKLLYMSPEQAWGKPVDKRSDVFSVGGVLYEMLTGRPLFFAENDTEVTILEKVREAQLTPIRTFLPNIPVELEKILAKALQKDPENRYQAAAEMQKDLDNLFYTEGYNATSASLASFARSLFPEDWGQEAGARETIVFGKEISDSMKAVLAEKTGEKAEAPISKTIPKKEQPSKEIPKAPPASQMTQPSPASASAATIPVPVQKTPPEVEPAIEPSSPTSTAPTQQLSTTGLREISLPEILPPQQTGGNLGKFLAGALALALIVGAALYFLFRPKPVETVKQPQQKVNITSKSETPVREPEATTPTPTPVATPTDAEAQKAELLQRIEEEKKKIEAIKTEDLKQKEEQRLAEEKRLEDQKKVQAQKEEEQRLAEEQKKAEAEKAVEEQRLREEAEAEQARLAQLQEQQATATPEPAVQDPAPVQETPQQPTVNEGDLVELTPDVVKPVLTKKVEAEYPPLARQKKIQGTVILQLLINENGQVAEVKVLRAAGGASGLNESAVEAARKWVFQPAVKAGKRVKVLVTYPIHFRLQT
jgi:TonB family protein